MAVNPEMNTRKIVTLPKPLMDRVKRFRHRREIDTEAEAIRTLLREALDAAGIEPVEATETAQAKPRRRPSSTFT
jgi:metal-responsive CopG/Arc/MetJ family transcriptional regulator